MSADLSSFKVVYKDRVLRALELVSYAWADYPEGETVAKPKEIEILAINEDGNIVVIRDETWMFQFIPVLK